LKNIKVSKDLILNKIEIIIDTLDLVYYYCIEVKKWNT